MGNIWHFNDKLDACRPAKRDDRSAQRTYRGLEGLTEEGEFSKIKEALRGDF